MPETITAEECKVFFVNGVPCCLVKASGGVAVMLVGQPGYSEQENLRSLEESARQARANLTKVRHRRQNRRG